MKEINGEKYYVSLGYVDPQTKEQGITSDKIKSLIMEIENGTIYVDDTDKDNIVTLPLMPVNDIQKSNNIFKFTVLIPWTKLKWLDKSQYTCSLNIVGLFAVNRTDKMETIRLVQFYDVGHPEYFNSGKVLSLLIEADESKILGE